MLRGLSALVAIMLSVAALVGCDVGASANPGKPRVVATTTMIGDLARRIGADSIDPVTIMPPGVDPHTYKPSTEDMGRLSRADLVLYNGLHLEGKMVELFEEDLKSRSVPVTRRVPEPKLLPWKAGDAGAHDPHVWFDASLWSFAALSVGEPAHRDQPFRAIRLLEVELL